MMKTLKLILVIFFILSAASVTRSQDQTETGVNDALDEEMKWLQEETFVISASRTIEKIKKSAASVTVITANQIRSMGARSLLDVLRTAPGLGVTQSKVWVNEIEVRGVKTWFSEKILFMLDGHPLDNNMINGGGTIVFDKISLDNVQRIEVVRGPYSALYGANAFLGLVNIITKNAADVEGVEILARMGSFDTWQYNILFGKTLGEADVVVNANFLDTDGYKAFVQSDQGGAASQAPGYSDQWGEKRELDVKLGFKGVTLQGKYLERKDGPYFGVVPALNDGSHILNEDYFLELGWTRRVADALEISARLYRDFFRFDNYWELFPDGSMIIHGKIKNTRTGGEIIVNYDLNASNRLIVGGTFERQRQFDIVSKYNYDPETFAPLPGLFDFSDSKPWTTEADRKFYALYVEDLWDLYESLRLSIGARFDHYSDFGGTLNPRIGLTWEFREGYDLKLMYGQGFRAPTFAELHNTKYNNLVIGNPDLEPERVKTMEASLGADFNKYLSARATLFQNKIKDLITIATNTHENSGEATSKGVELEMKALFKRGTYIAANYTYTDSEYNNSEGSFPDTPSHRGNVMANIHLSRHFNFYADLYFKGKTPRAHGDDRDDVPSHCLVNAAVIAKQLSKKLRGLELRASVYNVFDKEYVDPAPPGSLPGDYQMPGRSFMFEIAYAYSF